MDDALLELENELKRLAPRQPSPALMQSLEAELGRVDVSKPSRANGLRYGKWAAWSLAGVAAAFALVLGLQSTRHPVAPPGSVAATAQHAVTKPLAMPVNRYQPVRASSVLYDMKEGDPAQLPDRTEGRQVRYRYVDTYTWKNPATNASLRWSVPRDEVRLVRARLD